jgi:hypothetical protein
MMVRIITFVGAIEMPVSLIIFMLVTVNMTVLVKVNVINVVSGTLKFELNVLTWVKRELPWIIRLVEYNPALAFFARVPALNTIGAASVGSN